MFFFRSPRGCRSIAWPWFVCGSSDQNRMYSFDGSYQVNYHPFTSYFKLVHETYPLSHCHAWYADGITIWKEIALRRVLVPVSNHLNLNTDIYFVFTRKKVSTSLNANPDVGFVICREGHVKVVCLLLESGADVELPDNYGQSPLFMACWKG